MERDILEQTDYLNYGPWKDEGHRETQSYIQFGLMNQYGIIEDLLGVQQ